MGELVLEIISSQTAHNSIDAVRLHDSMFRAPLPTALPYLHDSMLRAPRPTKRRDSMFLTLLLPALARAMPNLEALGWFNPMCVDDTFFQTVGNLPIQHLKLYMVAFAGPYRLETPAAPAAMPLKSLVLFPVAGRYERYEDEDEDEDKDEDKGRGGGGGRRRQYDYRRRCSAIKKNIAFCIISSAALQRRRRRRR